MQTMVAASPYAGPRPSPARRWAPWVMTGGVLFAVADGITAVMNLRERQLQQQRLSGHPPQGYQVHDVLSVITAASRIRLVLVVAVAVVTIGWARARRNRARLQTDGEAGVEPRLFQVVPKLYGAYLLLVVVALVMNSVTSSAVHSATTVSDIVAYRTDFAVADGLRCAMWVVFVVMVSRVTRLQDAREREGPAVPLQSVRS